jgi:hypothetical protein
MGSCHRVRDLLGEYLREEATPGERRLVEKHLERCPSCATEARSLRGLLSRIPTDAQAEAPAEVKVRVLARVLAQRSRRAPAGRPRLVWAFAMAAGAGVMMAGWWLTRPPTPSALTLPGNPVSPAAPGLARSPGQVVEAPAPEVKPDAPPPLAVAPPAPAPAPRRYVLIPHRSTVTRHTVREPKQTPVPPEPAPSPAETPLQPQAPTPGASMPASEPIRLQWTPCPDATEYEVTVTDEGGEAVAQARVALPEHELPGLSLAPAHTYQVRVTALSQEGAPLQTTDSSWSFTTAPPP